MRFFVVFVIGHRVGIVPQDGRGHPMRMTRAQAQQYVDAYVERGDFAMWFKL
jgi:hypothetical protein